MKIFFSTLMFFVILFSCSNSSSIQSKRIDFKYSILSYNRKQHDYIFHNGSPTSLTSSEIKEIEHIVGDEIRETIKAHNKNLESKRKFYRQYLPVINGMGEKLVYIQCFAEYYVDSTWKNNLISIADGGSSVFSVWVNLTTKTSNEFSIHGEG